MRRLEWSPAAVEDREGITRYVWLDNRVAARKLNLLLREKCALVSRMPHIGRPGRVAGTREFVAHPSYVIVYAATGDVVTILRVLHAARQWP